jgi:uncharacterized protein YbcI
VSEHDVHQVEQQGGNLLARISREFVAVQKEYWGLGPVKTKSYMMDDLLLVVMRGGVTTAERTMLDFGRQDLVRGFRQSFENEMTQKLTGRIEELTGRKVLTYQSQILFDPDMVAELFVFEKTDAGSEEIVATAEGQLRGRSYGEVRGAIQGTQQPGSPDLGEVTTDQP